MIELKTREDLLSLPHYLSHENGLEISSSLYDILDNLEKDLCNFFLDFNNKLDYSDEVKFLKLFNSNPRVIGSTVSYEDLYIFYLNNGLLKLYKLSNFIRNYSVYSDEFNDFESVLIDLGYNKVIKVPYESDKYNIIYNNELKDKIDWLDYDFSYLSEKWIN